MSAPLPSVIELVIDGRARDLGAGFMVRRVLPAPHRQLVGPFIFFDQMGPVALPAGQGMDVRPHPHIALATVTYLFAGEIMHKDSVGSVQAIRPGDVNWMVAGRGIVHSERSSDETRRTGQRVHGIQSWVALPSELEESEPSFEHHPAAAIPTVRRAGVALDVIAGTAYGQRSPVGVLSPTLYVHAQLDDGAELEVDDEHEQRAVYVVEGELELDGYSLGQGQMAVLVKGASVQLRSRGTSRAMLVGGAKLEGERHMYWNFVSSDPARIERAKADWQARRFPEVPSDAAEFIPLPA
jgi:redox-sensitive bicupin YhaK (pirin superfamily)